MLQRRLIFAGIPTALLMIAWWLTTAESSPMRSTFLYHPALGNFLTLLMMPAIVAGTILSGNVHQPNEIITALFAALQWFGIFYLIARALITER